MARVVVLAGLALAAWSGAPSAADLGQGRERPARELRFDRELERERPRPAARAVEGAHVERRGPPYPVNWRGYPQSR